MRLSGGHTNRSPMNEIGGNAAVYIDPENPETAAAAVQCSLESSAVIREASLANAARFEVSTMIDSYLSLYEKVCSETYLRESGSKVDPSDGRIPDPYIDSRFSSSLIPRHRHKELS